MKKLALAAIAALSLGSFALPAKAQYYGYTCTRDYGSSVNLRNGPSRNYPVIASVPAGSSVRMLSWVWGGDNLKWIRVETSGIVGFARQDYICS